MKNYLRGNGFYTVLFVFLVTFTVVFVLSGCGGAERTYVNTPTPSPSAQEPPVSKAGCTNAVLGGMMNAIQDAKTTEQMDANLKAWEKRGTPAECEGLSVQQREEVSQEVMDRITPLLWAKALELS